MAGGVLGDRRWLAGNLLALVAVTAGVNPWTGGTTSMWSDRELDSVLGLLLAGRAATAGAGSLGT